MNPVAQMLGSNSLDKLIPSVDWPEGESGVWKIQKFEISEHGATMFNMRAALDPGNRCVVPGSYTRLVRGRTTVMSDTPAEKRDHYSFIRAAHGKVLVNGLGLGMATNALLLKSNVERVVVVENSEDVISLVAPHFRSNPRFELVVGDALELKPKDFDVKFDCAWHDIWDSTTPEEYEEMKFLNRRWGRAVGFQGTWCKEEAARNAAEERRSERGYYW